MKYQEAFFGAEFIAELRALDSEFLRTGNKLLSLHSMDTTSLSSALFLLALAKNDVRMEIMQEFERMVQFQLPQDEQEYFEASGAEYKFGPMFHRKKFQFFAQNARFVSLRGFFNAEVGGPDTLSPIQREFIRLAQIFKSRLVTEIEFRQRVMERALIEERINNYRSNRATALEAEENAKAELKHASQLRKEQQYKLQNAIAAISARIGAERERASALSSLGSSLIQGARDAFSNKQYSHADQIKVLEKAAWEKSDAQKRFSMEAQRKAAEAERAANRAVNEATNEAAAEAKQRIREAESALKQEAEAKKSATEAADAAKEARNLIRLFTTSETTSGAVVESDLTEKIWSFRKLFGQIEKIDSKYLPPIYFDIQIGEDRVRFKIIDSQVKFASKRDEQEAWRVIYKLLGDCERARNGLSIFSHTGIHAREFESANGHYNETHKLAAGEKNNNRIPAILLNLKLAIQLYAHVGQHVVSAANKIESSVRVLLSSLSDSDVDLRQVYLKWQLLRREMATYLVSGSELATTANRLFEVVEKGFEVLFGVQLDVQLAKENAIDSRRPLDHKKFLDMLIDDVEEKYIDLVEGTRAHTANIDNYIKRISTALEDDFNTQFYDPAFRAVRETSQFWDVQFGQVESSDILTNNRTYARVEPRATMEFDLPKRDILLKEAFDGAAAVYGEYGALMGDPNFLAMTKMFSGQPTASTYNSGFPNPMVRGVLPSLPAGSDERMMIQADAHSPDFASPLESLIPEPAIYSFETGVAWDVRPVIQPDGQAVVFHLNYMYTTNVREPVRADEKHLGRVKRHFIDTDVQLSNYELRQVSKYRVALKASRTSRGVPLLEDVPGLGILFRPLPQQESSLQENVIMAQTVIYPTLFDLMGLRWAPAVADLGPLRLQEQDFTYRNRMKWLREKVYDYSSERVDEFMRIPRAERRGDLYRTQETIPYEHPNGYRGPGMHLRDSELREGYRHEEIRPESPYIRGRSREGVPLLPVDPRQGVYDPQNVPLHELPPGEMRINSTRDPSGRRKYTLKPSPESRKANSEPKRFRSPISTDAGKPGITATPMRVTAPVATRPSTRQYSNRYKSRGRVSGTETTEILGPSATQNSSVEERTGKVNQASHEKSAPKASRLLRFFRRGSK